MTLTRRALLTGASATALLAACDPPDVQVSPSPLEGELGNAHLASRGHRIRQPLPASATTTSQDSAAVVIVVNAPRWARVIALTASTSSQ